MFISLLVFGGLLGQPAISAPAMSSVTEPSEPGREAAMSRQEARKARRARRANGPEVYKGRTAIMNRIVSEGGSPDGPVKEKDTEVESVDTYANSANNKRAN